MTTNAFIPCDSLPVDEVLPDLLDALKQHGGAVLEAPPGAGKSTRVPLALLDAGWRQGRRILMLEPRRVAARSVAAYMASRLDQPVGQRVGYRTRLDSRVGKDTVIEVVTEGVLTRMLHEDPALEHYAAVLFDEFHERSLQADLGLALVQEVRQALREDLRLLVMSATLDAEPLGQGLALPVVRSEGRQYPVTVHYRAPTRDRHWLDHCADCVREMAGQGTVLVFLPGVGEIRRLSEALVGLGCAVEILHGRLDGDEQQRVLRASQSPRVVLATNVAETSVTLDGVTTVVDSGLQRSPQYDPRRHRSRLTTRRISLANADQRAGRAGRLGPGQCLRLWSREEVLARHIEAETSQVALDGLVLDLARWGCRDPGELFWLTPPPAGPWRAARARLKRLGALDEKGALSELGRALAELPMDPEQGALVVRGDQYGCSESAAVLALLIQDAPAGLDREVDLQRRWQRYRARPGDWPLLRKALRRLRGVRADREEADARLLGRVLAEAFPDGLARRREQGTGRNAVADGARRALADGSRYLLADGSGARLPPGSALAAHEWLVVLDTDGDPKEGRIRLAWGLDGDALVRVLEQAPWSERVGWDEQRGRVVAERIRALGQLVIEQRPLPSPSPALIEQGLLAGIRQRGLSVLPWEPRWRQWQARVNWMHRLRPQEWPAADDGALLDTLEDWLLPFLAGRRSLRDLRDLLLGQALSLWLGHERQARLDQWLPERCTVASGRDVMIDYLPEGGPRLEVKLQECFGMEALPSLADGQLPLTASLLTPAGRPAAITGDLHRFWREGYAEVRKELRGRYPKHPWPEDPLHAEATARTKKGMGRG
ncbi:ATP-dependent helicase HrpB [Alcanivorax sp. 24]|uniref:ATP-dependent helicase HrpB n=1 Tax=Alcanivorax sp. 24 TaxID=2545266 RepID=UPI00105F85CF|nr:ATP-dependent helicase HrpB [Alcanivorax sp. 24]